MTIRLVSDQRHDGEAVIIPADWARQDNPQEIRVSVKDNTIAADLPPGGYQLFLSGLIEPFIFTAADEVTLTIPARDKITGVTATVEG